MPETRIANRPTSSNAATQPNNPPTRSRIGNWDVAKDLYLLGILKDQQLKGNGVSGNFPASSWMIILEEFKRNSSMEVKKENLMNRLKVLKQLYYLYHALANRSGWTWDHQNSMPIAPEETEWPDIIAANKNFRKIKGVPFPQYNDMDFLCGKNIAVGRNGISTNMEDIDIDGSTDGDDDLDDVHMSCLNIGAAEEVDETLASGVHVDPSPTVAAETESAPSVVSLKRRRSVMPSVSSRRIKVDKSDALDILVDVGKQNADLSKQKVDIAKEFLAREVAARPTIYSVKDCMRKLQTMLSEGLSMKQFIAGSEAIEDECKRDVFMELEGIPLLAWLARQVEVQDQHKPHKDQHFNSPEKYGYVNSEKTYFVTPSHPDAGRDWAHL